MKRPCTVALTGGLASGKSTAAAGLERRGAAVIDADRVVHELYRPGAEGARAVAELFGAEVLAADGSVDRHLLGDRVLADRKARDDLEAIIHPLVRQRIAAWVAELAAGTAPPQAAVVEAALLVETGSYRGYDLLVVVWCRPEQQLERAMARGMSEARARQLLAAQMPLDDKRRMAQLVIDNSGDRDHLEEELDRCWNHIVNCSNNAVREPPGE